MKKHYLFIGVLIIFLAFNLNKSGAKNFILDSSFSNGDTTLVRTFRFDSTMRSGMFQFPTDTTKTYEKIIMLYSMRCHNGIISTSAQPEIGCGQWDYNCDTYIVDSSQTDSLKRQIGSSVVSGYTGATLNYTLTPVWNYTQYTQQAVNYTSTISETISAVGTSNSSLTHPFTTSSPVGKNQYLWTASELTASGLTAGNITGIGLDLSALGSNVGNLRIKIKTTTQTVLNSNSPDLSGFTEVYFLDTPFSGTGIHRFNFSTPFNWNGTSNLLLEYSYTSSGSGINSTVNGSNSGFNSSLVNANADNYINIDGGASNVQLPSGFNSAITNKISIAFWCFGDPFVLPAQTALIEGVDAANNRQVNIHLPWSDGTIYWDCGNDGTGYDRISKAASTSEMKGQWNFWTFTKNATTGSMKIYLNGALWTSGTGKTKLINIDKMILGHAVGNDWAYHGSIDELSIWNTDLSLSSIQTIMYKSITPSHPDYAYLKLYLQFNEGTGNSTIDQSPAGATAYMTNATWHSKNGASLNRNFTESTDRPNTSFIKGVYTSTVQNLLFLILQR